MDGTPKARAHLRQEVIWSLGISLLVPFQRGKSPADWLAGLVGMEMRG